MNARLEELLERMVAPGHFPQISASEGHEVVELAIALEAEVQSLHRDKLRLDWLADSNNNIGNVELPRECVLRHIDSLRDAIDAAMELYPIEMDE
jgi:hypothetical protein